MMTKQTKICWRKYNGQLSRGRSSILNRGANPPGRAFGLNFAKIWDQPHKIQNFGL